MRASLLAWRSLSRHPARAALGIFGVAAVGALLFDMLLLGRGMVVSFEQLLDSIAYDVRVTATGAPPTLGPPIENAAVTIATVRALPEVESLAALSYGWATATNEAGARQDVRLRGAETAGSAYWSILEGDALPVERRQGTPSVVISRGLAAVLEADVGSDLRFRGRLGSMALPSVSFRVCGIAEFRFDAVGQASAALRLEDYDRVTDGEGLDRVDFLLVARAAGVSADETVAAIERSGLPVRGFSNEYFLKTMEAGDFSYFRQISLVLTVITGGFAFLLLTSLLTVGVNQRLGEIAGLRAIGFSRSRVVSHLLWESFLLVLFGGVLSIPLGLLFAHGLDSILRGMPGLPAEIHFFVFQPRALVLLASIFTAAGLFAALYPALLVARLPIASTLRDEVVS